MAVRTQRAVDRGRPVAVLNIGNTRTMAAIVARGRVLHRWCHRTAQTPASWMAHVLDGCVEAGTGSLVIGSVVPAAGRAWQSAARRDGRLRVWIARPRLARQVVFDYPHPETLGADRLANIVAVARRGGPAVVVVDAGTATTFDVVLGHRYVGGVIAPGPAMFLEYLAERTALLPPLRAGRRQLASWGHDTASAMRIGAEAGFAGMVRSILERMCRRPALRFAQIVATGGAADVVVRAVPAARIDADLTLRGLALLAPDALDQGRRGRCVAQRRSP